MVVPFAARLIMPRLTSPWVHLARSPVTRLLSSRTSLLWPQFAATAGDHAERRAGLHDCKLAAGTCHTMTWKLHPRKKCAQALLKACAIGQSPACWQWFFLWKEFSAAAAARRLRHDSCKSRSGSQGERATTLRHLLRDVQLSGPEG